MSQQYSSTGYQDDETTALLSIPDSSSSIICCGTTTMTTTSTTVATTIIDNNNNNNTNAYCTTNVSSYGAISNNTTTTTTTTTTSNNIVNNSSNLLEEEEESRTLLPVFSSSSSSNDNVEDEERRASNFVDIEEGDNNNNNNNNNNEQQNQNDPHREGENNTTMISNNDESNEAVATAAATLAAAAGGGEEEESSLRDGAIGNLTTRLRCLFSTITWPIVPLGTIVSLALLWVLYAASSLDLRKSCSHPLHSYALISLVLVAYIPNHSQVRSYLFQYSRERDGPIRPARVRMYDQFFHTVCLLYVYTGVTLIQTCREDIIVDKNLIYIAKNELAMPNDGPMNACQASCPNLYQALSVYVATLELFTFALILPLLFLPCIYLWFLQRATTEADAFAQLQDRLQEEEALLSNGGVTTGEILDNLEPVKMVSRTEHRITTHNESSSSSSAVAAGDIDPEQQLWILPHSTTIDASIIGTKCDSKECCICMSEFYIHKEVDIEDGLIIKDNDSSDNKEKDENSPEESGDSHDNGDCNDDDDFSTCIMKESAIVRTKCGHVFHHACIKGWVGGIWSINPTNSSSNINDNENNNQNWQRRKARQIFCPLCREDLRPRPLTS